MAQMTAEKFSQRCFDLGILEPQRLEAVWSEFGTRDVPLEDFTKLLVRRELLTNFQVDRLLEGKRDGYLYGDYKVLYLVGAGTFARVYRAVHKETGRVVAVKVLRQRYVDDVTTTDQFLREARMVMRLRHPNIVPIYEVQDERQRPFMIMEFVEGRNLRDFVKVRGKMTVEESLRIITDVANGLDYALKQGVTHRDLKMSNVLISAEGRAKLVDFGLAAISADMTEDAIANAPNPRSIDYAGLERATGVRKNDPRSDIYFVGCILYNMLSGKPPLFETRDRIKRLSVSRYREVKPVQEHVPDIPHYVAAVVARAMDIRAEKRYQTPGEMLSDVLQATKRVRAGDKGTPEEANPDHAAAMTETNVEQDVTSRTVMIVESKVKMQDVLRDRLKRRGYRVLVISDPQRALARLEDTEAVEPAADCVVFCTEELGEDAVEAFNKLGRSEHARHVPAILLVDQNQDDMVRSAELSDHRVILKMPLKVRELRATLLKLLSQPSQS